MKVDCPTCGSDVSSDGEFPHMQETTKVLMCPCGAFVTEHGEILTTTVNLKKHKKGTKPKVYDMANIATWANSILNESNFDTLF